MYIQPQQLKTDTTTTRARHQGLTTGPSASTGINAHCATKANNFQNK